MSELSVLRAQTKMYIGYNPIEITLMRADTVADGAGGIKATLEPIPTGAQTFRSITQNTNNSVFRRTIDGQEVKPEFVLLGEFDADVKHGDWYYDNGVKYEIVYVRTDRRYETWAEVAYRG